MADEKKLFPSRLGYYIPDDPRKKGFVKYYDEEGKRIRVYGDINRGTTYEDRVARAELLIRKIKEEYVPRLPVRRRVEGWIEANKSKWRKKTYYQYHSICRLFFNWLDGRPLNAEEVERYFQLMLEKRSKGTHNNARRFLRKMFRAAGVGEVIDGVEHMRHSATPQKYFQIHQRKLIESSIAPYDDELWFCCQCIYYLFIRPNSELRLLRVSHFDLDRWKVLIPAEVSKNGKHDYVSIPNIFRARVVEYLSHRRPHEWIFPGRFDESKPIGVNTLPNAFRKYMRELGFGPKYSLYSWKHTGAIACVQAGVHIKQLQIQLRHSSLEMTDRYLRQLGVNDLQELEKEFPAL